MNIFLYLLAATFWINVRQSNCFFISYYRIWVFSYFLFYFKCFRCLLFFLTFSVCFFLLLSLLIFFSFRQCNCNDFFLFFFFENQHHIDEVEGLMLFSISNSLPVVYSFSPCSRLITNNKQRHDNIFHYHGILLCNHCCLKFLKL